ncbi:PEP-CTERM sorting domain-containing protein [Gemmatimonas groenlandica]|uniref:PEP-CTERM sorting domain-containing protein n=1 Tax=Gemmatimonas groenlandica TaxID=2732249 RepID=A0A6M4IHS6_9BACT|nr:PEP-CTERM sorting domain-containing protein [Gemmatimonas groenlandica]QJR34654.1 PEP-CTERM sorting domain-containing protein [Gemmatimonas groenlandica]
MMHLLHRTIPFIAIAAVVTASSAGAQEREDSTSTSSAVVSLLGLGGNFVGFGGADTDASHPNAWNCAGGCAAFGKRGFAMAPFGSTVSALRASSRSASVASGRSALLPTDRADLSDYGWSRRFGADGAALDRLVAATEASRAHEVSTRAGEPAGVVAAPIPAPVADGAGRAPAWVAPGSSPVAAPGAWNNAVDESAAEPAEAAPQSAGRAGTPSVAGVSNAASSASAQSFVVAPLVTTVPEPSTVVLMAVGMSSLLFLRRRSARGR